MSQTNALTGAGILWKARFYFASPVKPLRDNCVWLSDLPKLPSPLPVSHTRTEIPHGEAGTAETIAAMRRVSQNTINKMKSLTEHGKRDFRLRELIGKIIEDCEQKDYYCYAQSIHNFVSYKIKYAYDPVGVELVESPMDILRSGIGDCDSKCTLFACLCEAVGLKVNFVTLKSNPDSPDYSHVFCEVKIPRKGWVTSDCTMPKKPFGWTPPEWMPRKRWPASGDESNMDGLGRIPNAMRYAQMKRGGSSSINRTSGYQRKRPARGVRGLGLAGFDTAANAEMVITQVLSGEAASELKSARIRAFENKSYADGIVIAAQMENSAASKQILPVALGAQQKATAALQSIQQTITRYSELVNLIQTSGLASPPQLAGMDDLGIAPTVVIALAAIGSISAAAIALAGAWAQSKSQGNVASQYTRDLSGFVEAMRKSGMTGPQIAAAIANLPKPTEPGIFSGIFSGIGATTVLIGVGALAFILASKKGLI